MIDKRQNELQDLLKEGATALREMRRGIANACAELRTFYGKVLPPGVQNSRPIREEKGGGKPKNHRTSIAYY